MATYISYEVIIPRWLEPGTGKAKKEELSYIIKVAGKEHIIRLKQKNNFLVANLPVFTYDSEGRKVKSHPYIPAECYYGGYVEGMAESLVALSTCFGLRGFLKIRDLNYGIEPLEGSRTFQHLLYLTNKTGFNSTGCGLRTEDLKHQAEEARRGKLNFRYMSQRLYVELYIVVDNLMFRYEGSNETRVIHVVLDTINMVYAHYRYLNIDVILVGLTIWKERNLIDVSSNGAALLENFKKWRTAHVEEVKRDTTHLFVHQKFDRDLLEAHEGGICKAFCVGIDLYINRDLVAFSMIISHMLGHNIGIDHDGPKCFCDGQTSCIMHRFQRKFAMFSDCSVEFLLELRMSKRLNCLFNSPPSVFKFKVCGNKRVDAGEQCDCGTEHQCQQDPCCHPNCTFKAPAVCAHTECCQNCQFAPKGKLCRAGDNLCDLPEYCSGKSMWCPEDMYKQDGTPCKRNAYCYAKKCTTHQLQCGIIFGRGAKAAHLSCFKSLNMVGDQVGNCGGDGKEEEFVKCKEEDIMCGRLHCSNVGKRPSPWKYAQSLVNGMSCWSIKYQSGRGTADTGAVLDGTACSEGKICVNRTCVPISIFKSKCDSAHKCHSKGVCNNHNNCHCDVGWAPPDCRRFGAGEGTENGK
uniref:disintegrin and metalloproteinase domain-containing protein 20-like n=1 Tax=Euleptes europaea TaxID=460621 RepID=UPI0025424217|nr:disintegrin and metalloproteinase domain-containing protein 20-like [Euleptes europaea]